MSSATVTGAILDPTGSAVPHAHITITDVAAGTKVTTESNDLGQYTLPLLKPGAYTITVDVPGFRSFERKNIQLSAGDHPTVDVTMQIGDQSETVQVTADPPLLQTADASIGQVVTSKQVDSLPLNGRTPISFAQYTVGVTATANPSGVHAYDNSGASAFSVGGVANKNSEILLDGSPDNASDNAISYSPPMDATAEVKLDIFQTDAAYGHSGGGVANQVTKSGTNSFHGDLFEFNQVSALNSNTYFNKRNNIKKGVYRYNQFGGSISGPVTIPKVFNGHDRLFFLFAYEGIRTTQPYATQIFSVPTLAERRGDFSALLAQGSQFQLYNPYSAVQTGNTITRAPFANNNIAAYLNPVAVKALSYYPLPNIPGNANGTNNYFSNGNQSNSFDNQFGRVDWNLGTKSRLYATVRHSFFDQWNYQYFGANNPSLGDHLTRENWGGAVGEVYTLTPSTVAEVRLNYSRYVQNQTTAGDGFDGSAQLGLPSNISSQSRHRLFPIFSLTQFQSLGTSTTTPSLAPFNSYGLYADVIKVIGNHNLKVGVDARLFEKGQFTFGNAEGKYNFDNTWVRASSASTSTVLGQDFAAFLLGLPTTATYDLNTASVSRQRYLSFFVQDDWRARPDLTLNFGLRFDKDFSPTERFGRVTNGFDTTSASPISAAAIAAYNSAPVSQIPAGSFNVNGGLTYPTAGDHRFTQLVSNMFSPRFGFAYSPKALGGNTVIRGGFGLFVLPVFPFSSAVNQTGYSQTTSSSVTLNNYLSPNATLSNPFPSGFVQPSGSSLGLATQMGNNITYFSPVVKNGYSERWTVGVQRQLPGSWLMDVVYVGSSNHRLPINYYPNYIPAKYLNTAGNSALGNSVSNPFKGLLPNSSTLNGSTVSNAQLLAVYPQFPVTVNAQTNSTPNGITVQNAPYGSSNYNALDVRVEKRTQKGLTIIANYQFSKNMEAVTYLNYSDPRPEYRVSQYDRPHHVSIGLTYDIPFGHERRFGGKAPLWVDLPLGGWTFNSVLLYQSGAPITFGNVLRATGTGEGVNNIGYNARGVDGYAFNRSAFVTSSAGQPQYNLRTFRSQYSTVRADSLNNWDASALKNFNFTESAYFQFRFEAFNVNNRPVFAAPNVTPTSGSFGQITSTQNNPRTLQMGARIVF
ncbi:MAG: TonB-dependent receptor [Terriglobus sp.]